MYSKTYSISEEELEAEICTIEAGVSQGIPQIRYLGNISSENIRSREKFQFIFSFLGRKLPGRKIRLNFSSERTVKGSQIDLAVFIGIYLAINNQATTENITCIGEVGMDGMVSNVGNCSLLLYLLSRDNYPEKTTIFIPEEESGLCKLYPQFDIQPINNVLQAIAYLEGRWEFSADQEIQLPDGNIELRTHIDLHLETSDSMIIIGAPNDIIDQLEDDVAQSLRNTPTGLYNKQLNSVIHDEILPIFDIRGSQGFKLLEKISILEDFEWYGVMDLRRSTKDHIYEALHKVTAIGNCPVAIIINSCLCGGNRCTCTTSELSKFRRIVRKVVEIIDFPYWFDEDDQRNYLLEPLSKDPLQSEEPLDIDNAKMKMRDRANKCRKNILENFY